MAKAKIKKSDSKRKAPSRAKNQFYVIKTAQEARENLTNRLETVNKRFIEAPLKSGKALVRDLKKAPRKTVVDLFDDGKEYITDLNNDTLAKIDDMVKDGKSFLTKARKNPRKAVAELIDDGKNLVENLQDDTQDKMSDVADDYKSLMDGLGHDARLLMEGLLGRGKKAFDKVPGKKRVEREINRRIQELPALLNLPNQKEIDSIVRRVKNLHTKVEALKKANARFAMTVEETLPSHPEVEARSTAQAA